MKALIILFFLLINPCFAQDNLPEIDELIKQGELQKAKNLLQNSSERGNLQLMYLGDIYGYEEDWDKATFYYKQLVEKEPLNAEFNFRYGGALGVKALSDSKLQALRYISDIKYHLEKATQLDKRHVNSRQALVELYMKLPGIIGGSEQKSRKYAEELANIDPVQGALAFAHVYSEKGENEKARDGYKEAIALFNNKKSNNIDRRLMFKLGKISADYQIYPTVGLELLNNYIKNYSVKDREALEWAYFYKAQIHSGLGEKQEAIKAIEKALTLRANFKEAKAEQQRISAMK